MLGPIRANGGNNQPRSTPPHRKNVSFTSTIFGPQASNSVAVTTSNLAKKNNLQIKSPKGLDRTTKSNPSFPTCVSMKPRRSEELNSQI